MRNGRGIRRRILSGGIVLLFGMALFWSVSLSSGKAQTAGSKGSEADRSDLCHIRMTYPITEGVSDISDLEEIAGQINRIAGKEIGVEVELIPVDPSTAGRKYPLWLSRGEVIDLMFIRGEDIRFYSDKGLLSSLSGQLERNADTIRFQDRMLDGALTQGAKQQGKVYGIKNFSRQQNAGYGLWVSAAVLEEAGFVYDENHLYSLEEIDRLLFEIKSRYSDSYPLGQITAEQNHTSALYYMKTGNSLGADLITGVVDEETMQVKNFFETEAYQEFLMYMERWYRLEYVYPDNVIYNGSVKNLLEEGNVFLVPGSAYPGTMDLMLGKETDYVCLKMVEPADSGTFPSDYWTVPITSRYPVEAVKFLNLLYEDQRLAYLFNYGIVEKHYEIADPKSRLLKPLFGGFYNPFADIGDTRELYAFGTGAQQQEREALYEEVGWKEDTFVYSTQNVRRQIDEIQRVIDVYTPLLESGSVRRQENYVMFLKELREAGMDEVLADKQKQLDEYRRQ